MMYAHILFTLNIRKLWQHCALVTPISFEGLRDKLVNHEEFVNEEVSSLDTTSITVNYFTRGFGFQPGKNIKNGQSNFEGSKKFFDH